MAITLAALPAGSIWKQALVLAVVAIGMTVAVYGVVALTVKATMSAWRWQGATCLGDRPCARTRHRSRHAVLLKY